MGELIVLNRKMSDEEIVTRILAGNYLFAQGFHDLALSITDLPGVGQLIDKSSSELERLKITECFFPEEKFIQLLDETYNVLRKKDELAKLLKEKGDKLLKESSLPLAIRSYNLATLFIPGKSKDIGALFAQRASALLQWGKRAECLFDIETACSFTLSQELKTSLVEMKLKCLELKSDTDNVEDKYKQETQKYLDNVLFNISANPNPKLQCGSEFIKIVSNKEKGRHIVITKDLDPGVTLIVEDPYEKILHGVTEWGLKHCSYCFTKITAGIRCRKCVFSIYCSDTCRKEDFYTGHQYECRCLAFVHCMRVPPTVQLCLKIICKTGPKVLYEMYENSKAQVVDKTAKEIKGFDPETGIYKSDSYYQIRNLISHDFLHGAKVITIPWLALTLIRTLEYKSQFFSGIKVSDKSGFISFVVNELLFLCHSAPFNTFGLYEHSGLVQEPSNENENEFTTGRVKVGSAIYSLTSLMNTSCDPTVFRANLKNGKMTIFTNRRMKAGEEATVSYGFRFNKDEFIERQTKIKKSYRFDCNCCACRFKWPTQRNMTTNLEFICPNCSGTFDYRNTDEAKKRLLIPFELGGKCKSCGAEFGMSNLRVECFAFHDKLTKAHMFGNSGKVLEAIPLLLECIGYYQARMLYPSSSLISAQEQFRKCQLQSIAASSQTNQN